jgi:hypothetical protein
MKHQIWIAVAWTAISGSMFGCSDDFTPRPAADASSEASVADGGVQAQDASVDGAPILLAAVRLAQWSPDLPPLDVCLALHGSPFAGLPLVANLASALDAGAICDGGDTVGLVYPEVSSYINMPAGTYDVRLVGAGSTDCSTGLVSDLTSAGPLLYNTFNTLAIIGEVAPEAGGPLLRVVVFPDDSTSPPSPNPSQPYVGIRFINAAPSVPSAEIGTYDNGTYAAIATDVAYGTMSTFPSADRNGYVAVLPMEVGDDIAVRASDDYAGTHQAVTSALVSVAGDTAATLALVASGARTSGQAPLDTVAGALDASQVSNADAGSLIGSLVVCIDNTPTVCPLAPCTVVP